MNSTDVQPIQNTGSEQRVSAKLGDFGKATEEDEENRYYGEQIFFTAIMSPEMFSQEMKVSKESDVGFNKSEDIYQGGLLLYRFFSGVKLGDEFFSFPNAEIIAKQRNTKEVYRVIDELRSGTEPQSWPNFDKIPPELQDLVLSALSKDPAKRPTANQVIETLNSFVNEKTFVSKSAIDVIIQESKTNESGYLM